MGADSSFEVKNIEIWVPAFFKHNNSSGATVCYMKVKRIGIIEILRRIWLIHKIKSYDSVSKQPTQLIIELNSSLRHIIVKKELC